MFFEPLDLPLERAYLTLPACRTVPKPGVNSGTECSFIHGRASSRRNMSAFRETTEYQELEVRQIVGQHLTTFVLYFGALMR